MTSQPAKSTAFVSFCTLWLLHIVCFVLFHNSLVSVAGIMMAFACLGPAMGYILGGLFLNIYVDVGRTDEE